MQLKKIFNGDKVIWLVTAFLAAISCLVVFSCSTSINTVISHIFHLIIGFILMIFISKTHYKYYTNGSILFYFFSIILLLIIILKPVPDLEGIIDSRRWLKILGFNFQPSELAKFSLVLLLSRNLTILDHKKMSFKQHFKNFYFPIVLVFLLIFKSNGSTALIILFSSFIILFLSEFSFKNLINFYISNIILIFLGIFLLANFSQNSRVVTWKNRINNYISGENNYQVNIAQKAITSGKWNALGPGKSIQKHVLPQASSDFIFAIIIEEYSIVGGFFILTLYIIFLLRIIKYALKIKLMFPYLLLVGLGVLIVFQAFLNISVSLGIIPVTGQTLPLISKGGSSILITSFAIGIILNITSQFQNNLNYEED